MSTDRRNLWGCRETRVTWRCVLETNFCYKQFLLISYYCRIWSTYVQSQYPFSLTFGFLFINNKILLLKFTSEVRWSAVSCYEWYCGWRWSSVNSLPPQYLWWLFWFPHKSLYVETCNQVGNRLKFVTAVCSIPNIIMYHLYEIFQCQ